MYKGTNRFARSRVDPFPRMAPGGDPYFWHKNRDREARDPPPRVPAITAGWMPSCQCDAPIVPCTVLDPFSGAGTTALVADALQREAIGIELNPSYVELSRHRRLDDTGGHRSEPAPVLFPGFEG